MTTTLPEKVKNPIMMLITKAEMKKLTEAPYENMTPIIKLFGGPLTWLVTHIDEEGVLYGYADLNQGCVEFGGLCRIEQLPTMKCGIGLCGSCCIGEKNDISVCKNGPIFSSKDLKKFPQFGNYAK